MSKNYSILVFIFNLNDSKNNKILLYLELFINYKYCKPITTHKYIKTYYYHKILYDYLIIY